MRAPRLCALLVFLLLWDVSTPLAASLRPRAGTRPAPAGEDLYPIAMRYREQLRRASAERPRTGLLRPGRPTRLGGGAARLGATRSPRLAGSDFLYSLMS